MAPILRKATYPVDEILELIKAPNGRVQLDGDSVRVTGVRLKSFAVHGTVCVVCGLEGAFFAKEKGSVSDTRFHLNLYALDKDGREVLMTRDHVMPKSKGGSESINNMQTMCARCNGKKGDKLPVAK